jgi:hypothetical protein
VIFRRAVPLNLAPLPLKGDRDDDAVADEAVARRIARCGRCCKAPRQPAFPRLRTTATAQSTGESA